MTRLVPPLALALAIGCGQATPDASPPAEPAHSDAVQQATTPADVGCDSIIVLGRRVLGIEVQRTADREVENPFVRAEPRVRPGCRVIGADSTDRAGAPVDDMYQALESDGWKPLLQYQADGPDGSVTGFLRATVICVLTGRWDGGDDADSTYVPRPGYEIEGVCFGLMPADTAGERA